MVFLECATHEEPGAGAYIRWVEGYEGNRAVSISVAAVLPGTCSSIVCFLKQKGEEGGGGRGEGEGRRGKGEAPNVWWGVKYAASTATLRFPGPKARVAPGPEGSTHYSASPTQ